ncbi:alkylresorcinol/alkylpyrone synthase [Methylopila capsulata]|uniref:Alkylresorcinol/alkylpyrone synthase n=1 Tax=Methylopila capsulata TaxID=61654 RepID=A0ABS2T277_9HYPH|nr:type III polyketide synthase [Methylopila capsulata]MBM7850277.1 alkylresorcinol/alkylpyrone synthase [Methylopila capsulata]
MTTHPAKLLSVASATAPHNLGQDDVVAAARRVFVGAGRRDFDRIAPVYANAGVLRRQSVRPLDWYVEPHGWEDRTAAYLEGAGALFVQAAQRAIAAAGLKPGDIDVVVTVSSTGVATPSLEARFGDALGLRADVMRVPVFGLGCAGGVSGLGVAARLARGTPGTRVLLVAVETCTLAFRLGRLDMASVVSTALFGDGAAACVLATGPGGLAEVAYVGEHRWPDTLDVMGWRFDDVGFDVVLDRAVPAFAAERVPTAARAILAGGGVALEDVRRFVCHPGGAKVAVALEGALGLADGALADERAVLAAHGNMSAPTVLFVLERALAGGLGDPTAMLALGPGFTASMALLRPAA